MRSPFLMVLQVDIIGFWDMAPIATCICIQSVAYISTVLRGILYPLKRG